MPRTPAEVRLPGPDAKPCKRGNIAPRNRYGLCLCAECQEAKRQQQRSRYRTDPEYHSRQASSGRTWRRANTHRTLLNGARQRAAKAGIPFDLTLADITIPATCPALGIPLVVGRGKVSDGSPTLDRIVPSLGYVRGNIAVLSLRANRIKNDATADELEQVLNWLRSQSSPTDTHEAPQSANVIPFPRHTREAGDRLRRVAGQ